MSNQDHGNHASRDSRNLYNSHATCFGFATGVATRMTEGKKTTEIYQKPQKLSSQNHRNHASRDLRNVYNSHASSWRVGRGRSACFRHSSHSRHAHGACSWHAQTRRHGHTWHGRHPWHARHAHGWHAHWDGRNAIQLCSTTRRLHPSQKLVQFCLLNLGNFQLHHQIFLW